MFARVSTWVAPDLSLSAIAAKLRASVTLIARRALTAVERVAVNPLHRPSHALMGRRPPRWPARDGAPWGAAPRRLHSRTTLRELYRRHRSRQRIAALDGHALKDIGVTYAEAECEANKPFWRA